ncbi:ABC transporter permease [Streptomyces sp. NPDC087440]|uniref:ABC transporter permease n=1 Tax=Streptomyces sp. NPDC087440 TaxID=3365790 RepID=UPI003816FDD9
MSAFTLALGDGVAMTRRNIIKNCRNLDIVVFTTAAPIGFALLFAFVFGSAIDIPGTNYREFLIVGILAQTMLSTATNTGVGIAADMKLGLIDRFRSLPMSPSAVLVGRTTSDVAMNLLVIAVMSVTGLLIGWRIRSSFLEALAGFGLLLLFAYAISWITAAIGLGAKSPEALSNSMFMFMMPMTFISNAFVPTEGLPTVLRVIAEWSPVSALVGGCRELFGNVPPGMAPSGPWPVENPVVASLAWIAVILLIFIPLSVRRYTKTVNK